MESHWAPSSALQIVSATTSLMFHWGKKLTEERKEEKRREGGGREREGQAGRNAEEEENENDDANFRGQSPDSQRASKAGLAVEGNRGGIVEADLAG